MMRDLVVETLGDPIRREAALPDLARLRIAVFRDWPYLYDGSLDYERAYLAHFLGETGAVLVVARKDEQIVGVATASPMSSQDEAFRSIFEQAGHPLDKLFYFGESVLLPGYRGHGIGHRFFDHREAAARAAGADAACFCAVVRPEDHPLRPAGARDLTPFWRSRGYESLAGVETRLDWKDIDQQQETGHIMQFWHKTL